MQVSISDVVVDKKAGKDSQYSQANNTLRSVDLSLDELMHHILEMKVWSSGIFEGSRNNEHFQYAETVAVDVDKGISIDEMLAKLEQMGIKPNLWYHTQSHSDACNKYRLLWRLFEPVKAKLYKLIASALVTITGADKCTDPARYWLGSAVGGSVLHTDNLDLVKVEMAFFQHLGDKEPSASRKALSRFQKDTGVVLVNGLICVPSEVVSTKSLQQCHTYGTSILSNYRTSTTVTPPADSSSWHTYKGHTIFFGKPTVNCTTSNKAANRIDFTPKLEDGYNWDLLTTNCRYYRELMNGEVYIGYEDCGKLALSLCGIKGGAARYKQIVAKCSDGGDTDAHARERWANWAYTKGCTPPSCQSFCPYASTCTATKGNMLRTGKDAKATVRLSPLETITKAEGRQLMTKHFESILSSDKQVSILVCPVGLGKTSEIRKHFTAGWLYAAPTHAKALEEKAALEAMYPLEHFVYLSARPKLFLDDNPIEELVKLELQAKEGELCCDHQMVVDACRETQQYLVDHNLVDFVGAAFQPKTTYDELYQAISDYQSSRREARDADRIICTHQYLFTTPLRSFKGITTVAIDEDITMYAYKYVVLSLAEAQLIYDRMPNSTYAYLAHEVLTADDHLFHSREGELHLSKTNREQLAALRCIIPHKPLDHLMYARTVTREGDYITFLCAQRLPTYDKKIIVATATPAISREFETLFGVKPDYYEVPDVQIAGKIIHYQMDAYKTNLDDPDVFAALVDQLKDLKLKYVITFKKFKKLFEAEGFVVVCTFGMELGLNSAEGFDIAVIGSWVPNPIPVHLKASYLQQKTISQSGAAPLTHQYKGIRYRMMGYHNEYLRELAQQEALMHLIQSAGRARLIDNNSTVHIFGVLPHPQSTNI